MDLDWGWGYGPIPGVEAVELLGPSGEGLGVDRSGVGYARVWEQQSISIMRSHTSHKEDIRAAKTSSQAS